MPVLSEPTDCDNNLQEQTPGRLGAPGLLPSTPTGTTALMLFLEGIRLLAPLTNMKCWRDYDDNTNK